MEPVGVIARMGDKFFADFVQRKEFVRLHLGGVWLNGAVVGAEQYVVELVFGEAVIEFGAIGEAENFFEGAIEPHFFGEAAVCGRGRVFSGELVAAAGVGPQAGGVIFIRCALLQEHFPVAVDDEHGECAMEEAFLVCFQFFHGANGLVFFVDEDDGR